MDLLSEYDDIYVDNKLEFTFAYEPDGLEDLAYHVKHPARYFKSDIAILRFKKKFHDYFKTLMKVWNHDCFDDIEKLTNNYINDICQVQWEGRWGFDVYSYSWLKFSFYRIFFYLLRRFPYGLKTVERNLFYRTMYLSINPKDFDLVTQNYVRKLFSLLGYKIDEGINVFNQLFSGDNPVRGFQFYEDAKAIVVDKDPRDLYVLCKREVRFDGAWIPTDNVDDFISYYKTIHSACDNSDARILHIRFEDLIYEYDSTVTAIENFLGVKKDLHSRIKTLFRPSQSINNTQLFRKYKDLEKDVKRIEDNLSEFLYPYDNYPVKEEFGASF